MPRINLPFLNEPDLQFRYWVTWSKLSGILFYAKSASQPKMSQQGVKIDYGHTSFYVKGKTEWEPINLTFYQFTGIAATRSQVYNYFRNNLFDVSNGRDRDPGEYLDSQMNIQILSPIGIPVGTWKLINPWFENIDFGQMDWSSEDVIQIEVTVRYDRAEYSGI